jgi:hypothetical protein
LVFSVGTLVAGSRLHNRQRVMFGWTAKQSMQVRNLAQDGQALNPIDFDLPRDLALAGVLTLTGHSSDHLAGLLFGTIRRRLAGCRRLLGGQPSMAGQHDRGYRTPADRSGQNSVHRDSFHEIKGRVSQAGGIPGPCVAMQRQFE